MGPPLLPLDPRLDDPGWAGLGVVRDVWSTWEDCHVFHRSRRRTLESVLATPEEVAQATLFLASDLASAVSGITLDVSCGEFHGY